MATEDDRRTMLMRRLLDTLLCLPAGTFCAFTMTGYIEPKHRPFECDDQSLNKTYNEDTISAGSLFLGSFLTPMIVIALGECGKYGSLFKSDNRQKFLRHWFTLFSDLILGELFLLTILEFCKTLFGELRPHFLATCIRNMTKIDCSRLVEVYNCEGDAPEWLKRDVFKSFPSGHAAISFYCFIFISLYCQFRIPRTKHSHLFRFWVQIVSLIWAIACSLTRITDNRHHWWDVLIGVILGIAAGFVTGYLIVQNKFAPKQKALASDGATTIVSQQVPNSANKITNL